MQEPHSFEFRRATKEQSADIARLIMMAMTDECCLYFCRDGYGLEDFYGMMTRLVEREAIVGLLVDKGNPIGEALYASLGFRYMNDNSWGGHSMKHMVL